MFSHLHLILTLKFFEAKSFSFLFPQRWVPRTPRWLIANNHLDEAHELLMKFATGNRVTVDPAHLKHVILEVRKADARKATDGKKYGILDALRTPKLRKRTLIMFFNW